MATARNVRAGRAYVELGVDDKIAAGLKAAGRRLRAFGTMVESVGRTLFRLGAVALAPLALAARTFATLGDDLAKMSRRTGVSVEALSELTYAADLSAVSATALETGLKRMARTIYDADRGLSTATDALGRLGLAVGDLLVLSPEEQFTVLAERLSAVRSDTIRAALALEIFGRAGTQLLPMIEGGAAGVRQLRQEAQRLGLTISTADARAAEEFQDAMTRLWRSLKRTAFTIGSALAPVLQDLSGRLANWLAGLRNWLSANRGLILGIAKVAAGTLAAGLGLMVLGRAIGAVGAIFNGLAVAAKFAGSALGLVASAVAFLLTPLGMTMVAAAAFGAYLIYVSGMGAKALAWLGDRFGELRDEASAAWAALGKALAKGDIGLAAKVLWATLRLEWQKGAKFLSDIWAGFLRWFGERTADVVYGSQALWAILSAGMQSIWTKALAGMASSWAAFEFLLKWGFANVASWYADRFAEIRGAFDKTFDVEAAEEFNRQLKEEIVTEAAGELLAKDKEIATDKAKKLAEIETDRAAALVDIAEKDAQATAQRNREYSERLAASQKALADARAEWEAVLEEAGAAPAEVPAPPAVQQLRDALAGLPEALGKAAAAGTFYAAEAGGMLAAAGPLDRIASASEKTANNTRDLLDEVRDGGGTFE